VDLHPPDSRSSYGERASLLAYTWNNIPAKGRRRKKRTDIKATMSGVLKSHLFMLCIATLFTACISVGCKSKQDVDREPRGLSVIQHTDGDSLTEMCIAGKSGAPIKIEIFSDYQCIQCRSFYFETLKPLLKEYIASNMGKCRIVYHDIPSEKHLYGRKAARLALAAGRISRELWLQVTDLLYKEQDQWSQQGDIRAILARSIDTQRISELEKLAADAQIDLAIQQEIVKARSRKVISTPTIIIHSKIGQEHQVAGRLGYDILKEFLDGLSR